MRLKGKSAVITGASSGIGYAIAELFAKEGANVVAVARRRERLEELQQACSSLPGRVEIYPGDVSIKEVNEGMIDFALKKFGRFDILVNDAGIMDNMAPIGDFTTEKFNQVMSVNVYGPMCAMQKAVNLFEQTKTAGSIVNIASAGAFKACAGAVYCASKAALVSLTRNTAYMYMKKGIRCNCIAPGGIETDIAASMGQPDSEGYEAIAPVLAAAPKPGKPVEIAEAALFLASDEASYVNGAVLPVDGGWMAS